jgi:dihydrodipicolinate synthase/N-acetylneuraminate lyase
MVNNPRSQERRYAAICSLADVDTIVSAKIIGRAASDLRIVGDRFILFAGLDDVVVESIMVGAVGWVSVYRIRFARRRDAVPAGARGPYVEAMNIYRWFIPLLHLDCAGPGPVHHCTSSSWARARSHATAALAARCERKGRDRGNGEARAGHALAA